MTVPVRWKDTLVESVQGQLVVTKNPDGCLSLYPLPVWLVWQEHLLSLQSEHEAWRRVYIGSATDVEIDSGSRVLIPPELRDWAGLDDKVKFMGVGPHFELWDNARYDEKERAAIAAGRPDALRNFVYRPPADGTATA